MLQFLVMPETSMLRFAVIVEPIPSSAHAVVVHDNEMDLDPKDCEVMVYDPEGSLVSAEAC